MQAALGSGEDLLQTLEWIAKTLRAERGNSRVVLDGYHFGADYQLGIKEAGLKLLVVDDYGHADFYHADWVLNQNISARESLYAQRSSEPQLLLGPKFAMLRKEFLAYKGWQRKIAPVARKILVTLGGSDPDNVTLKVIQALVDLDLHIKIVVGGSNPHLVEIGNFIQSKKNSGSVMDMIVNTTNMPGLMAWADIAVAAGGSTAWELAFMGLPSVFVILAENQIEITREVERAGFGKCLGKGSDCDRMRFFEELTSLVSDLGQRVRACLTGTEMVCGQGARLVIQELVNLRVTI